MTDAAGTQSPSVLPTNGGTSSPYSSVALMPSRGVIDAVAAPAVDTIGANIVSVADATMSAPTSDALSAEDRKCITFSALCPLSVDQLMATR